MPRQARGEIPSGTYHLTLRTAGPIAMFVNDVDRFDFCHRLKRTITQFKWTCRAFCLMTTHYHLLVDVERDALQPGMHRLNGQYAQEFNKRHGRSGHLHGDRYGATRIETDGHMLRAFRYILRNPVRAGLCASPAEWNWSSYRGSIGLENRFPFVRNEPMYAYFGSRPDEAIRGLRAFVEDV